MTPLGQFDMGSLRTFQEYECMSLIPNNVLSMRAHIISIITGDHSNQDPRCTQKPMCYTFLLSIFGPDYCVPP